MYNNKKILAIIPARGGSKGLPKKNIKPLLGKPLVAWSIEQALNSKYIDRCIVSTDSEEIAQISRKFGADVPFLRPDFLAADSTPSMDVLLYCIDWLEKKGEFYDLLAMIEPTSPLRDSDDIDKAVEILDNTENAESIVGVSKVEGGHPDFLVSLENNFLRPYTNNDFVVKRRQEISDLYFFEGSLYISYVKSLKERNNFYHKNCLAYVVPKWKSLEIDDYSDFIMVEALMKAKMENKLER